MALYKTITFSIVLNYKFKSSVLKIYNVVKMNNNNNNNSNNNNNNNSNNNNRINSTESYRLSLIKFSMGTVLK